MTDMSDRFVRDDHPDGAQGAHGSRWRLAEPRTRGDSVEAHGVASADPGVRISVMDYRSGTNTPGFGVVSMDLDSAIAFGNEIVHIATDLKKAMGPA